ncbi:MAG: hypothetical protein LBO21_06465 [Synergistaceae bacterium]|jgi:Rod binding domain-containing protein|nr:hypothetical protein [Synergistaceae bacterium]
MTNFEAINRPSLRNADGSMSVEEYRRQEKALETSCKQFEGTMFSKIWKDMMKSARSIGGEDDKRIYAPLEDTVMEMVSEHLSESQGIGVWKVLYDNLHSQLEVPDEIKAEGKMAAHAANEEKNAQSLRPSRKRD